MCYGNQCQSGKITWRTASVGLNGDLKLDNWKCCDGGNFEIMSDILHVVGILASDK